MNKEIQLAILRACGRYVRKMLDPIEKRMGSLEQRSMLAGPPGDPGRDGRDGLDGKNAEPLTDAQLCECLSPLVEKHAGDWLKANPPAPGVDGVAGRDGADGVSFTPEQAADMVSKAIEDRVQARAAAWELEFERRAAGVLERAVDRMPKAADGLDGKDGRDGIDGLSVDDLKFEYDGDRGLTLRFVRGEHVKVFSIQMPIPIYRGTFAAEKSYDRGDTVTWGGSQWIAIKSAPAGNPGSTEDWKLAVKRGDQGKKGEVLTLPSTVKLGSKP